MKNIIKIQGYGLLNIADIDDVLIRRKKHLLAADTFYVTLRYSRSIAGHPLVRYIDCNSKEAAESFVDAIEFAIKAQRQINDAAETALARALKDDFSRQTRKVETDAEKDIEK